MNPPTLREKIDVRSMTAYQWALVFIAAALMATEGYDVQAMAFTSNAVTADLDLTGTELGLLLSGGLAGMAAGSLGIGPFADRFGRRPMILVALGINAFGLFLTTTAGSMPELLAWRVVTGLGIGGIMTSSVVLVSEYSNAKHRALALAVFSSGFPFGATVGGLLAVPIIRAFDWQGVFMLGGLVTLATITAVAVLVPESIDHLAARQRRGRTAAQHRAEKVARRMGVEGEVVLNRPEEIGAREGTRNPYATLVGRNRRRSTLTLWLLFFLVMACFYFVSSWTPRLFAESGLSEEAGIYSGMMLMAGGLAGNISYGYCSSRWDVRRTMSVFALVSAALMVAFVSSTGYLFLALTMGLVLGAFINGCMTGLYTLAPMTYPTDERTTGVGAAMAAGRLGGILSPIAVGALLDIGWPPFALYALGGAAIVLAAVVASRIDLQQPQATTVG